MRGKVKNSNDISMSERITPAYAGKSSRYGLFCAENKDHPRLCGEKSRYSVTLWITAGSPPPMRGKVFRFGVEGTKCGITPAYAGKSILLRNRQSFRGDHPRLCGEKTKCRTATVMAVGSPPPMRGKAASQTFQTSSFGITPAYAGKRCYTK